MYCWIMYFVVPFIISFHFEKKNKEYPNPAINNQKPT